MSMRLILALLLLASTGAQGLDTEENRATLRGLNGVRVVVEAIEPNIEREGLTRQQILTDAELRLRKAGIRVLTEQERFSAPGRPWLCVRVLTYQVPGLMAYALTIEVQLYQNTSLERAPHLTVSTVTWSTSSIGAAGRIHVRNMYSLVTDRVDRVINAYLSVNPEQAGRALPPSQASPPTERR
jgi:hypothetical protein